ncbi:hypothetical protein ANCCAN_19635 [Ancylostoma caninum]|uniref:G-protein coupled receptors family 1 profile domain-containing protein n=1 Tax=Ancylostoma caninum TaxID=29170 RepID=A0A368FR10_ANCCA|nr:hypothetical protein ANCCAN_19635 [Ancylostoma caninum]
MPIPDGVCGYTETVTTTRFVYISLAGLVAVFGAFSNILLFILFQTTPSRPPSLFPAFLALLDALLCFCFIFIFVLDVNMMYLKLPGLFTFYHNHVIFAFSTAKIVQFLIPYMLIFATFERYTWIANKKWVFLSTGNSALFLLHFHFFQHCIVILRTDLLLFHFWHSEDENFHYFDFCDTIVILIAG